MSTLNGTWVMTQTFKGKTYSFNIVFNENGTLVVKGKFGVDFFGAYEKSENELIMTIRHNSFDIMMDLFGLLNTVTLYKGSFTDSNNANGTALGAKLSQGEVQPTPGSWSLKKVNPEFSI